MPPRLLRRIHNRLALFQCHNRRHFQSRVRPALHRRNPHRRMPLPRRRDVNKIQIGALTQILEIVLPVRINLRLFPDRSSPPIPAHASRALSPSRKSHSPARAESPKNSLASPSRASQPQSPPAAPYSAPQTSLQPSSRRPPPRVPPQQQPPTHQQTTAHLSNSAPASPAPLNPAPTNPAPASPTPVRSNCRRETRSSSFFLSSSENHRVVLFRWKSTAPSRTPRMLHESSPLSPKLSETFRNDSALFASSSAQSDHDSALGCRTLSFSRVRVFISAQLNSSRRSQIAASVDLVAPASCRRFF